TAGQSPDHRPERPSRTSAPPDDLAQVIGVHADFQYVAATKGPAGHLNIVREMDDATHEVLEGFLEHVRLRSPARHRRSRPLRRSRPPLRSWPQRSRVFPRPPALQ